MRRDLEYATSAFYLQQSGVLLYAKADEEIDVSQYGSCNLLSDVSLSYVRAVRGVRRGYSVRSKESLSAAASVTA